MTTELSEREYERVLNTYRTASEWHSGQWSALYSYASTWEIHGEDHRDDMLREIDSNLDRIQAGLGDPDLSPVDLEALDHLRYTVECWPNEAV